MSSGDTGFVSHASTVALRRARSEHRFYVAIAAGFVALVLWTFARTYYLKLLYRAPPLSSLLHVHAIAMTGWVLLLMLQAALVSARRVDLHRRIGVFGAGWAAFVVVLGSATTIHAASREVHAHSAIATGQLFIMGLDLLQMLLFGLYVALAVVWRQRPDIHKRLMLLTIGCMLPDALARLPVSFMTNGLILVGLDAFVLLAVLIDTLRHRRLHPAFAWGAGVFIVAFHTALVAMQSKAWLGFAAWLVR